MKRISLIFLVVAFLFAVAGCKNGSTDTTTSDDPVTVNVLAYGTDTNYPGTSFTRIVKEFETANPTIKISYELHYDADYHTTVASRIAANAIPDMAYMGADARWGKPWADAGQQYNIKPLLDPAVYDFNLIPSMGSGGEYYELPLGTANLATVMFMNTQALAELGLSTTVPASYDDLKAMVSTASAKSCEVLATHGADAWAWGSCVLSALVARTSGDPQWVRKALAGTEHFTDAEFVDALALIKTMKDDGVLTAASLSYSTTDLFTKYNQGKVLFMISGQWDAGNISETAQANTKLIAFPSFPGEIAACAGSVAGAVQVGYGITAKGAKDDKVRAAALKFLNFYNSNKEVTDRLRNGQIVAPVLKDYAVPDDLSPIMKNKVSLAQKAPLITDILDAYFSGAWNDAINTACINVMNASATPAAAAANLETYR